MDAVGRVGGLSRLACFVQMAAWPDFKPRGGEAVRATDEFDRAVSSP
jgi:hypothetical protein